MHRVPWWKTWGFVGLLSMVVSGRDRVHRGDVHPGASAGRPDARLQSNYTPCQRPISATPSFSVGTSYASGTYPGVTFLDVIQRPLDAEEISPY